MDQKNKASQQHSAVSAPERQPAFERDKNENRPEHNETEVPSYEFDRLKQILRVVIRIRAHLSNFGQDKNCGESKKQDGRQHQ